LSRVLLFHPVWRGILNPPASVSQMLELQAWATRSSIKFPLFLPKVLNLFQHPIQDTVFHFVVRSP
jgi:hypothetical protein